MFNKSVQSNRNILSGQLHRIIINKQTEREDIDYFQRKNSLKYSIKEQINYQKSHNYFNARNSIDSLDQVFRVDSNKKFKSPVVVLPNRKLFVSQKNRRNSNYVQSQEPVPQIAGVKKVHEYGYRIVLANRTQRMPIVQMDEEVRKEESKIIISSKDPISFTDWVERIYGKEWFY